MSGAIFMAPFFLLFRPQRQLADRFDKAIIARRLKFTEIGAAGVAVVALRFSRCRCVYRAPSFRSLAALFTPVKYGILPDHLDARSCRPATP